MIAKPVAFPEAAGLFFLRRRSARVFGFYQALNEMGHAAVVGGCERFNHRFNRRPDAQIHDCRFCFVSFATHAADVNDRFTKYKRAIAASICNAIIPTTTRIKRGAMGVLPMERQLTAASAKALLNNARDRALKTYGNMPNRPRVFALRATSLVAVLKACPGLLEWKRLDWLGEVYGPFFNTNGEDWRVEITEQQLESEGFRAKVIGPFGSYLEATPRRAVSA
jgi:hypothetical protein